jgi:hypothetical protein
MREILKLDLDPADYYNIPDAAFEYLHYAMEHSDLIHHAISNNPFTETIDEEKIEMTIEPTDEVMALFREKDHPRDRQGRFRELGAALKKLGEAFKGSPVDSGDHSAAKQTLEKAGIPPSPEKNGTVRRLEAGGPGDYHDVYVDPVSGSEALDHPDGSTTVRRGSKANVGIEPTVHPRIADKPPPSKFGEDAVHLPKPTPDNTKLHVGFPVKAEIGFQTVTKREDGVWESSHGPVGPAFAKALDILLSKEEKVAQAENKLDKADTLPSPPKTTNASDAKPTPTSLAPTPTPRKFGLPIAPKSSAERKLGFPIAPKKVEGEGEDVHADDVSAKQMNWVEKAGGLPRYIKEISDALQRDHGMTESRAIATAVNRCKKWCAGAGDVHPDTRAKACAAVAEWEAKKKIGQAAEAVDVLFD